MWSNISLSRDDSIVKIDKKSDQEVRDKMLVSGKCGFCKFKHPVKYKNMNERMECNANPERGNELDDHMDTNHEDVTQKLENY